MTNYKSLKLGLINRVMLKGKKWKSEIILNKNFKLIQKKKKKTGKYYKIIYNQ